MAQSYDEWLEQEHQQQMNIFEPTEIYIGLYVNKQIANHFSLISLKRGESRSAILRTLLSDFLNNEENNDIDKIIDNIAIDIVKQYQSQFLSLKDTIDEAEEAMRRKKIAEHDIERITNRVNQLIIRF